MTTDYPATIPYGTPFRIRWPTGKPGLRKTHDTGTLASSPYGLVYLVLPGDHPAHSQTIPVDDVIWDPAERTEALEKIRIAEEEVR